MRAHGYVPAIAGAIASGVVAGAVLARRRSAMDIAVPVDIEPEEGPLALPVPVNMAPHIQGEIVEATIAEERRIPLFVWLTIVLVGCLAVAALAARPRINNAAAPPQTPAGFPASLSYSIGGFAHGDVIFSSNGIQRRLHLHSAAGTIPIPSALTREARDISVVVRASGPLGSDAEVLAVRVLPAPKPITRILAPEVPVIRSFTLSKPAVHGGGTVVARYDGNAPGFVRLTDSTGSVWSTQPVTPHGAVALMVPKMHAATPFIVVLESRRKNHIATASAGFIALANSPSAPAETRTSAIPGVLRAGGTVAIGLPKGSSGATFTLTNSQGAQLVVRTAAGSGGIRVRLPEGGAPATLFATLTYEQGKERQTFVRHVAFTP